MAENFIAEAFSLLSIALVFIALRLYSRIITVGFRRLALDDYLMVFAGVSEPCEQDEYLMRSSRVMAEDSACIQQRQSLRTPLAFSSMG